MRKIMLIVFIFLLFRSLLTLPLHFSLFFFFNDTATTEIYTLSLHDALPIFAVLSFLGATNLGELGGFSGDNRSEEHTSELQSHHDLVCRLLLEKKKKTP